MTIWTGRLPWGPPPLSNAAVMGRDRFGVFDQFNEIAAKTSINLS
jgi:hypothetical protein